MKKLTLAMAAVSFLVVTSHASAIDLTGKTGVTGNVGFSEITKESENLFDTLVKGEKELIIGGKIFYGLTPNAIVGLDIEWEKHRRFGFLNDGDLTTITILPFLQIRSSHFVNFSPYALFGAGVNINSFDESPDMQYVCLSIYSTTCELEPDNTVAIKIGGGFDYFLDHNTALNVKINWKYNSGEAELTIV